MTDWTPIESKEPSELNAQLDAFVAAGCPTDSGRLGWLGLAAVVLLIAFALGLLYLFVFYGIPYAWHIPPVSTPGMVW